MVAKNEHTGDSIRSKVLSKQGEENWERIFGKKNVAAMKEEALKNAAEVKAQKYPLCTVCGDYLKDVLDCNRNSCPKNEET